MFIWTLQNNNKFEDAGCANAVLLKITLSHKHLVIELLFTSIVICKVFFLTWRRFPFWFYLPSMETHSVSLTLFRSFLKTQTAFTMMRIIGTFQYGRSCPIRGNTHTLFINLSDTSCYLELSLWVPYHKISIIAGLDASFLLVEAAQPSCFLAEKPHHICQLKTFLGG